MSTDFLKIETGLSFLLNDDRYLLKNNLSERSITHKLAEHYQKLFRTWDVDCEYNKNLRRPKEITIEPRLLLSKMADHLGELAPKIRDMFHNNVSPEDINSLKQQLCQPKFEYLEDRDVLLFLIKINNQVLKERIYPDIIIHKRGKKKNHIVIEAKKSNNTNAISRIYDLIKLATLVLSPEYKYKKGIFIEFPISKDLSGIKTFKREDCLFSKVYKYIPKY